MVKLAERFTQKHPDIQIEYINIVEGGPFGRDKLQQMIAGGTPPDVMMLNTGQFEGFASRGVLAPLDDLVKQDNVNLDVYWPPAVVGSKYGGKLYGLPKDISAHVVYLNKDIFQKAGVALPKADWNWNDFRTIAKQLTKDTNNDGKVDQWGTSIINAVWAWGEYAWTNGGEILSDDRKECKITMPETVEALKFYYGLLTEDKASPPPGTLPQQPWQGDQFLSGVIGMGTFGPWFRPGLVENKPFDWTVVPFPRSPTKPQQEPISALYTDQWGMSAKSEHPKEAWELLKFLGGPEGHTAWSEIYGSRSITPIKELALGEKWMSYGGPEHRQDNQTILDQLDSTKPPPVNFANANAAENAWNEEFDLVMTGQQTVEQATQNVCEKVTPILQQP
jgi:multiple sugar transport system substrate-binding protein